MSQLSKEPLRVPRSLPRGPSALPRDVVIVSQRRRLLDGMASAVDEKGYASTTVADVIRHAGVSRTTFYDNFTDKEDCFLATYQEGAAIHFEHVRRALTGGDGDALQRFRASMREYLRLLAAEPAWARSFLVEVMAAGPRVLEMRAEFHRRYVEFLRAWLEEVRDERGGLDPVPDEVLEAAVGAIDELAANRIRDGRAAELPDLEDVVVRIDLTLFGLV